MKLANAITPTNLPKAGELIDTLMGGLLVTEQPYLAESIHIPDFIHKGITVIDAVSQSLSLQSNLIVIKGIYKGEDTVVLIDAGRALKGIVIHPTFETKNLSCNDSPWMTICP